MPSLLMLTFRALLRFSAASYLFFAFRKLIKLSFDTTYREAVLLFKISPYNWEFAEETPPETRLLISEPPNNDPNPDN